MFAIVILLWVNPNPNLHVNGILKKKIIYSYTDHQVLNDFFSY